MDYDWPIKPEGTLQTVQAWTRRQIESALEAIPGSDCTECTRKRKEWLTKLLGEVNRS